MALQIVTNNNPDRIVFSSDGSVGIGIQSPPQKLDVFGGEKYEAMQVLKKAINNSTILMDLFQQFYDLNIVHGTLPLYKDELSEKDLDIISDDDLPLLIGIHPFIDKIIAKRIENA